VFVEFGQVVIGCCKECQVSWEYDRGSVRGEWRKGEPLVQWIGGEEQAKLEAGEERILCELLFGMELEQGRMN